MKPWTEYIADALIAVGIVQIPKQPESVNVVNVVKKQGVYAQVSQNTYNPDAEFEHLLEPKYKPFDMSFTKDPEDREIAAVSAQLYEVSTDGKQYRVQKYNKAGLLEAIARGKKFFESKQDEVNIEPPWRLREAQGVTRDDQAALAAQRVEQLSLGLIREGASIEEVRSATLREDFDGGGGSRGNSFSQGWTNDSYGDGNDGNYSYIPLIGGPWNKQLYQHAYLEMHAKAFEAYNHNPYAHQVIQLTTLFTLGRGLDHTCTNTEVDEIVSEFMDRTEFYERLETMMTDLWWTGENLTEFYEDTPKKGQTDFRTMDPSTVLEIVTDPDDIRKVYYAHQQYSTPYQTYVTGVSAKDQPVTMKYIIRQVPAANFDHVKINVSDWEKRGRSDLFCVLGWLKRLKDLLNARVIKGQLEAAFVWDITIKTGDADVDSIGLQLPDPYNPGATFIHNNALELKPQAANMGRSSETSPDVQMLIGTVATGLGTSADFLGAQSSRSGGGAGSVLARTTPPVKRYESRQMLIERYCHKTVDRVLTTAADAGLIDLDAVLQDARSVKRLADPDDSTTNDMDSQRDEMAQKQQDYDKQEQQQNKQTYNDTLDLHKQSIAANGQQNGSANGKPSPTPLINVNRQPTQEAAAKSPSKKTDTSSNTISKKKPPPLNDAQNRRIKAIKTSGMFSRELVEFTFPAIAQEDRAAKLKDLALAEAMEWLPKSITATMAAKELNITTYDFVEMWGLIVQEAKQGMSVAHIFAQENKHVPEVVVAQGVQEESQAEVPVAQQPILNVPTPPAVAGMKQEPNPAAKPGGGGGAPGTPGSLPMSGDTKVNHAQAPTKPKPSAPSPGYSAAANHPMAGEGANNMKMRQAAIIQRAIYTELLREAVKPLTTSSVGLARYLLENRDVVNELEAAVAVTERDADS